MKYNINWIKEKFDADEKIKYIFFWGHRKKKDGSLSQSCLSQWWEQSFFVDEKEYKTAEHWMMAEKAKLFNDMEIFEKILLAKSPGEAKALGRKVRKFNNKIWEANRSEIVKQGNLHKFSQHEDLKTFLLNTGERVLVESSPVDFIWGIGLAKDAEGIENPHNWRGPNLLGFVLVEVRDELR